MDKWNQTVNGIWDTYKSFDGYYFCSINVTGVNKKTRKSLSYKKFASTIRPVAHSADIPIPEFKKLPDLSIDEHSNEEQHD